MAHDAAMPPGFIAVACAGEPACVAAAQAASGAEPGTVLHAPLAARCTLAVILAPDRPVGGAEMCRLAGVALHDALASLAPVGIPVAVAGEAVHVNGAVVATFAARLAPGGADGVPDWAVLAVDVAIDLQEADPGRRPHRTCLAEEGFDASAGAVMAAFCRHLLSAIDAGRDDAPGARRDAT